MTTAGFGTMKKNNIANVSFTGLCLLLSLLSFRLDAVVYYEGTATFRTYGKVDLNALVQFLPYNPVIIEAGAYQGDQTVYATKVWPYYRTLIAFEPNPSAFAVLQQKIAEGNLERVQAYNVALNNYNGEAALYISQANEKESSLLAPTPEMQPYYQGPQLQVPCVALDDWCAQNQIGSVDILSLELEGLELKVLEGSSNILKNTKIVILQSFFQPYRIGMCNYFFVKDFLVRSQFVPLMHWYEQGEKGIAVYVSQEMYDAYFIKCLGLGLGGLLYP